MVGYIYIINIYTWIYILTVFGPVEDDGELVAARLVGDVHLEVAHHPACQRAGVGVGVWMSVMIIRGCGVVEGGWSLGLSVIILQACVHASKKAGVCVRILRLIGQAHTPIPNIPIFGGEKNTPT